MAILFPRTLAFPRFLRMNLENSPKWIKDPNMLILTVTWAVYHVSCEPLRIFWNDDTTRSTRVPRVLSTTGWKARNPARSRQHAWHSCRAGYIVFSANPQGLATHMVLCSVIMQLTIPPTFFLFYIILFLVFRINIQGKLADLSSQIPLKIVTIVEFFGTQKISTKPLVINSFELRTKRRLLSGPSRNKRKLSLFSIAKSSVNPGAENNADVAWRDFAMRSLKAIFCRILRACERDN